MTRFLQSRPELLRADPRQRALGDHRPPELHHVGGRVRTGDSLPTFVTLPFGLQARGLFADEALSRASALDGRDAGSVMAVVGRGDRADESHAVLLRLRARAGRSGVGSRSSRPTSTRNKYPNLPVSK